MKTQNYFLFSAFCAAVIILLTGIALAKDPLANDAPGAVGLSSAGTVVNEDEITDLNNQGYGLLNQGDIAGAEQTFKQVLGKISAKGQVSPTLFIAALNGIGLCDFQERKFAEAENTYLQAKKVLDANPINDGHIQAMVLNNLGQAYRNQSKFTQAESCYKEAIKKEQELPKSDRRFLAATQCNLALTYCQQKQYTDAESMFTQGMSVLREVAGDLDPAYQSYIPYYKEALKANGHKSSIPGI